MTPLNAFLSTLAFLLLVLAIPVLAAAAFQWFSHKNDELRSRLTAQQQQWIDAGVSVAVRAAEQMGLSGQVQGGGQGKKAFAIKTAQEYLDRLGVKIDVNALTSLIEAEVRQQLLASSDATKPQEGASLFAESLSEQEKAIYNLLKVDEAMHLDEILDALPQLSSSEVLVSLLELEFKNLVRQLPGKNFVKIF